MTNRTKSMRQSSRMAFCGLMVALSVVLMLSSGLIPIMTYCAPMFCGVLLLPIMIEFGAKDAWTAFAATAFIVLLLGVDKEAAFFYLFLGYYPIIKWRIEHIKKKTFRVALKLLIFNASVAVMYVLLGFIMHMDAVVAEFTEMSALLLVLFIGLLNACLLLYDRLLVPLSILYVRKFREKLKFLHN